MQQPITASAEVTRRPNIYTVSELNANIKNLLEERFAFLWVFGEISNFRAPASGHFYFTLKDESSQIGCVMFRGQRKNLKFEPSDGQTITGMGRVSVFEPRGTYQIILEYLEPSGAGALQLAFEKLKNRLAAEGCFDAARKRPLPLLPQKICIITSPTGAVVHDILHVVNRRFPNVSIRILPVKVQGDDAVDQIVAAFEKLNELEDADVAILARGGGSLEDLQAFNSEPVARAILASRIPVVSAVGHETDYTISDFAADLRAPTPSAAAELVVPDKGELLQRCQAVRQLLNLRINHYFKYLEQKTAENTKRLMNPRRRIEDGCLRLDDLAARMSRTVLHRIRRERQTRDLWADRLGANSPLHSLQNIKKQFEQNYYKLFKAYKIYNNSNQMNVRELTTRLASLSPLAILERGYSITRSIPEKYVVKNADDVVPNQDVEVILARGRLFCRIKGKSNDGENDI